MIQIQFFYYVLHRKSAQTFPLAKTSYFLIRKNILNGVSKLNNLVNFIMCMYKIISEVTSLRTMSIRFLFRTHE